MGELKKEVLLDTIRRFGGQPKTITVHRVFVDFTGSLEAGMMLSQLLYWSERDGGRGRVAKTDAEWIDELCLTQYAVRQARKALENMGILRAEVHRFNGVPTVHYFLLEDALSAKWELWIRKNEIAKPQERNCETAISLTESTTESTTENGADPAPTSPIKQEQPIDIALIVKHAKETPKFDADAEFDALPSASVGMVPRAHTAATADPHIAEKEFVRQYAPVFALICQRAKPITEDRQAARRAFGKHFDITRMNERLTAYQNGDGGDFRKPEATAFWIVNRLEKDLAQRLVTGESWDSIPRFRAED